jgi:hypothetical protein
MGGCRAGGQRIHRQQGGTFQELITGSPCSVPSVLRVPGTELEQPAPGRLQPQPAGSQHPQQVPVGYQDHVAVRQQRGDPAQHRVRPVTDLRQRLTGVVGVTGDDAVAPQVPPGPLLPDLRRGRTLVSAVVPFPEVGVLAGAGKPGQRGRPDGAPHRAGEGGTDVTAGQRGRQRGGGIVPRGRERHIRAAGVPVRTAPLGLSVPDKDQLSHGHLSSRPTGSLGGRTCRAIRVTLAR